MYRWEIRGSQSSKGGLKSSPGLTDDNSSGKSRKMCMKILRTSVALFLGLFVHILRQDPTGYSNIIDILVYLERAERRMHAFGPIVYFGILILRRERLPF